MPVYDSVGKPAGALWFRYRVPELGSYYYIIHKMNKGVLDLQLSGRAGDEFALAPQLEPILPEGMSVARTSKSLALRVSVPVLMPNLPFEEQREALTAALLSAENFLKWIRENRVNLQKVLGQEDSPQTVAS